MQDRRRSPRIDAEWQLTYRVMDNRGWQQPVQQTTVDVSTGGIRFSTHEELSPHTLITFELASPDSDAPGVGMAQVAWTKAVGALYESGASFCWHEWGCNTAPQMIRDYVLSQTKLGNLPTDPFLASKTIPATPPG